MLDLGLGKRWSLRKQENGAKRGAKLRGWRGTESDGDALEMPCISSGTK